MNADPDTVSSAAAKWPHGAAWLRGEHERFPAWLHRPAGTPQVGVIIVSPFGWEDLASYRPRRTWATSLAEAGFAAARFDLPGTGDAEGDAAGEDRVGSWRDAIAVTARWLRAETGVGRVVAIGIGLGGMLALAAAADGAPIDDFVLWAAPSRGKAAMRELRAFATLEAGRLDEADQARGQGIRPEGWIVAGGFSMSPGTRAALEQLDAGALAGSLEAPAQRRALVLGRDGVKPDKRLVDALESAGLGVRTGAGTGFSRLLLEPQFARLSDEVVAEVRTWLGDAASTPVVPVEAGDPDPEPLRSTELSVGAATVRETFVVIERPEGYLTGILTEPVDVPALPHVAMLIGGTGHRIGPNRMWVEAARRWATRGVPAIRIDVAGAGDSANLPPDDTASLYEPSMVAEVEDALRELHREQPEAGHLVVGLCAGAYWALHAAIDLPFRVAPVGLNLPTLEWDLSGHADRLTSHYRRELLKPDTYRRLLSGRVSVRNVIAAVRRRLADKIRARLGRSAPDGDARVLGQIASRDVPARLLFAGREPLRDELVDPAREGAPLPPSLLVDSIPGTSDLHTLRPLWAQRELHVRLDAALEAELEHAGLTLGPAPVA